MSGPVDLGKLRLASAASNLAARVPARFVDAEATHPDIDAWANRVAGDPSKAGNLAIFGPTGVGKTHAGFGALRSAILRRCARGLLCDWEAITHTRMIATLRPGQEGSEALARTCCQSTLLMIDDLGAARQTPWSDEQLLMIVDDRWSHRRPMIITSNLGPEALLAAVGSRVASRLTGGATTVIIGGHDLRMGV